LKEGPETQGFEELRGGISPDSDKRIEVLSHSGKRSWSKAIVEGTVKNISSSSVGNIQVRVYFYGASWEELADFPFALEPGKTKNFKAEFLGTLADKITSYEIRVRVQSGETSPSPALPEIPSKPASLLASDAEYYKLFVAFKDWGLDFNTLYDTYSKKGLAEGWTSMWIGITENENHRVFFDRVGNKWKPRTIP